MRVSLVKKNLISDNHLLKTGPVDPAEQTVKYERSSLVGMGGG